MLFSGVIVGLTTCRMHTQLLLAQLLDCWRCVFNRNRHQTKRHDMAYVGLH